MRVAVLFLQVGLVHMRMRVFGPVGVGMHVFVLHMLVLVAGMRMCMSEPLMAVFVGVRFAVGVLIGHCHLRCRVGPGGFWCAIRYSASRIVLDAIVLDAIVLSAMIPVHAAPKTRPPRVRGRSATLADSRV